MSIKLSPLALEDEAAYYCEITYENPEDRWFKDSCQSLQLTKLNVLGKPDSVSVTMENGTEISDGDVLGPYTEGTELSLKCKASGGRPVPEVRHALHFPIAWGNYISCARCTNEAHSINKTIV